MFLIDGDQLTPPKWAFFCVVGILRQWRVLVCGGLVVEGGRTRVVCVHPYILCRNQTTELQKRQLWFGRVICAFPQIGNPVFCRFDYTENAGTNSTSQRKRCNPILHHRTNLRHQLGHGGREGQTALSVPDNERVPVRMC
jgi:hypothetical protein